MISAIPIYGHGELSQALRSTRDYRDNNFKLGRGNHEEDFGLSPLCSASCRQRPPSAWERGDVDVLAVLPDVTPGVPSSVEGLTVGPDGNIYVTSFGFNAKGAH